MIGSRAYGLDQEESDTDRRGIYLPTAESYWSLYGVPEQLEDDATQEVYWELKKFIALALKANPNILERLYSPIVETATPLAQELLAMKKQFSFEAGVSNVQWLCDITVPQNAGGSPQPGHGEMEARDAFDPTVDFGDPCASRRCPDCTGR